MKNLLLITLGLFAATSIQASVILGGTSVNPSFDTNVILVTDSSLNILAADLVGTNALIDTGTLDSALLFDDSTVDGTEFAISLDLTQGLALILDPLSFTGSTINALGVPLTGLTNNALLGVVGPDILGLTFLGAAPGPNSTDIFTFDVTSITQATTTPEPTSGAMVLSGILLLGGTYLRSRKSRA